MPARWRCTRCKIEFSGDGASRHYLAYPKHELRKLHPIPKVPSLSNNKGEAVA